MSAKPNEEGDFPLPEDAAIAEAFPMTSGRHDLYDEARRLVTAKHSKGALVNLVNWLLHRAEISKKLLLKIEWAGATRDEDGRRVPACPSCGGVQPEEGRYAFIPSALGHRPDCELHKVISRIGRRARARA